MRETTKHKKSMYAHPRHPLSKFTANYSLVQIRGHGNDIVRGEGEHLGRSSPSSNATDALEGQPQEAVGQTRQEHLQLTEIWPTNAQKCESQHAAQTELSSTFCSCPYANDQTRRQPGLAHESSLANCWQLRFTKLLSWSKSAGCRYPRAHRCSSLAVVGMHDKGGRATRIP